MATKKPKYTFVNDGVCIQVKSSLPMWDGTLSSANIAVVRIDNDSHCCGIMRIGNFSHSVSLNQEDQKEILGVMIEALSDLIKKAPVSYRKGYMFASLHSHGKEALKADSLEKAQEIMVYPLWSQALLSCGFIRLSGFINPNSGNYVETYGLSCVIDSNKKDFINVA